MEEQEINGVGIEDTPLGRLLAEKAAEQKVETEPVVTPVETTEVVNTPVEAAEVKTDVVEETVEAPKKALDLLTESETPIVETKNEFTFDSLPEDIKAEIEFAKKLKSNPLLELFEKGATEADLIEFAKSIVPKDNSALPFAELVKMDFQKELGLDGEDLDTAVSEYLDEVQSMQVWKQKQAEKTLRDKFTPTAANSNEFLSKWRETVEANKPAPQPTPEQIEAEVKAIVETDKTQISEIGKNLIGAEFEGVILSEAEVNEVVNSYDFNEVSAKYLTQDSKFNVKKFVQDKLQTSPAIIQKRIEAAVAAERAKLLKEFGGVDKGKGGGGSFEQGVVPANTSKAALEYMLGRTI